MRQTEPEVKPGDKLYRVRLRYPTRDEAAGPPRWELSEATVARITARRIHLTDYSREAFDKQYAFDAIDAMVQRTPEAALQKFRDGQRARRLAAERSIEDANMAIAWADERLAGMP